MIGPSLNANGNGILAHMKKGELMFAFFGNKKVKNLFAFFA
jgi:hypothetical protein